MTLEEAIKHAEEEAKEQEKLCKRYDDASGYTRSHNEEIRTAAAKQCEKWADKNKQLSEWLKDYKRLLERQSCSDVVSRQAAIDAVKKNTFRLTFAEEQGCEGHVAWSAEAVYSDVIEGALLELPPVTPQKKIGRCKDCKYFEYDSVAKVDGIPLIVAHEICSKWGDGCKTKEDGYCFLFEPKMQEVEE